MKRQQTLDRRARKSAIPWNLYAINKYASLFTSRLHESTKVLVKSESLPSNQCDDINEEMKKVDDSCTSAGGLWGLLVAGSLDGIVFFVFACSVPSVVVAG